jgi:hypothetical protein
MNDRTDSACAAAPDDALAARANRLQQELIALLDQLAALHAVRIAELGPAITVPLQLSLAPARHWAPTVAHQPLYTQLRRVMEECAATTDAYQPGRVFSFRANSADGPDCVPSTPTAVFAGYSPTGAPRWQDFHQQLLDRHDARVDMLFTAPARIVSHTTLGRDLKAELLATRGRTSHSYNILGQITAGYFDVPDDHGGRARCALTAQIVEYRSSQREFALALNVIGTMPNGAMLKDALDLGRLDGVTRACQPVQRALQRCARAVRALPHDAPAKARSEILACIPRLLAGLCETLERSERQAVRRTRHAQQRRADERPVQCALDDARHAAPTSFFCDDVHATVIVRGPHARAHVFAQDGRHVTTFTLQDDDLHRRVLRHAWRPATAAEIAACRAALAALHHRARGIPAHQSVDVPTSF